MNQFEIRELGESETFDPASINNKTPFTQADFYVDWQKHFGRKVRKFEIKQGSQSIGLFQIIKYHLLKGKNYLYIPYGPVIKSEFTKNENLLVAIKEKLAEIAREENAVFVRLDFTPQISNEILTKFFSRAPKYTYHSAYFQPRTEWFLSMKKSSEELYQGMHEKTRYAVRLAERKEVKVEIVTEGFEKYFDNFYKLMNETSDRNEFGIHEKKYYENVFKNLGKTDSFLAVARLGTKILAIDVVIVFGGVANYVFAGSSTEDRSVSASYLAKWKSFEYCQKIGVEYYNFGGVSSENDPYKSWENLTRFKKRFGGQEVKHSDFYDLVVGPFWYHLYNLRKLVKTNFRL